MMNRLSKKLFLFLVFCNLLSFVFETSYSQCQKADVDRLKKRALVIGESRYSIDKLPHALNDAVDIAEMFKRIGFETVLDTNSKQEQVKQRITRWIQSLRDADVAIFYFAGHGGQVGSENYLYPIDAPNTNQLKTIASTTIKASDVKSQMETVNKNINIIMLDACRDDPTRKFALSRSWKNGLKFIQNNQRGTIIGYPVEAGKTVSDGSIGRNSNYARAVIDNFQIPDIPIITIFQKIEDQVKNQTISQSEPQVPITSFSGGSASATCVYFPDGFSTTTGNDFFSTQSAKEDVNSFRKNLSNEVYEISEDSVTSVLARVQKVIDKAVQNVVDSLGKKFQMRPAGYEPDYLKGLRSYQGIVRRNLPDLYLAPFITAVVTSQHTLKFSIVSEMIVGKEKLKKFELDNNIMAEQPLEFPLSSINYQQIRFSVQRYFFSRRRYISTISSN